jgi:hypothetical protein
MIGNGIPPNEQIRPRLRRCKICTLPPPCPHQTIENAKVLLINELKTYPHNPTASICQSYHRTGRCQSMHKRNYCQYNHPPMENIVFNQDIVHQHQHLADAHTTVQLKNVNQCVLCKLNLSCNTHYILSKFDKERQTDRDDDDSKQRCPLCTLYLPCIHFTTTKELEMHKQEKINYSRRYPIKTTYGQPNCIRWVQTGSCSMYDTLGVCCFWHPQIYASEKMHGLNGMPGEHSSSGGMMNIGKTKLARLMYEQDQVNLNVVRKRSEFPMNPKTNKPNKTQWAFPSPPLFKLGFKKKKKKLSALAKLKKKQKNKKRNAQLCVNVEQSNVHNEEMKKEETEDQRETRLDDERKERKQFTKERLTLRTLYWHLNDND